MFSFRGEDALRFLDTHYGPECAAGADVIRARTAGAGFCFMPYASGARGRLGVSFHRRDYLERRLAAVAPSLKTVIHQAQARNHHHDVIAVQKSSG